MEDVVTGQKTKPLSENKKPSGVKKKTPLKAKPKVAALVSRQGFRSTLTSAGARDKKPEACVETDSTSDSDDSSDEPAAVLETSCTDGTVPSDSKATKEKKRYILFVGNLPYTADMSSVMEYFKKHGTPAKEVRMLSDKTTGKPRGCCFVEFDTSRTQQGALKLHHMFFEGRKINIEVTCGGGGNTEARRAKIKKRNLKIEELRQKRKSHPQTNAPPAQ